MILITTAMSTTTISSVASIAITTNTMIYNLFLFYLVHFVESGSNICSLKDFQFLAEKTWIILVGTFNQEITSYAKRGNSISWIYI